MTTYLFCVAHTEDGRGSGMVLSQQRPKIFIKSFQKSDTTITFNVPRFISISVVLPPDDGVLTCTRCGAKRYRQRQPSSKAKMSIMSLSRNFSKYSKKEKKRTKQKNKKMEEKQKLKEFFFTAPFNAGQFD